MFLPKSNSAVRVIKIANYRRLKVETDRLAAAADSLLFSWMFPLCFCTWRLQSCR